MAVYNSYVMEETVEAHRNPVGKVIGGVLDFKDDLVSQWIGNVHAPPAISGKETDTRRKKQWPI